MDMSDEDSVQGRMSDLSLTARDNTPSSSQSSASHKREYSAGSQGGQSRKGELPTPSPSSSPVKGAVLNDFQHDSHRAAHGARDLQELLPPRRMIIDEKPSKLHPQRQQGRGGKGQGGKGGGQQQQQQQKGEGGGKAGKKGGGEQSAGAPTPRPHGQAVDDGGRKGGARHSTATGADEEKVSHSKMVQLFSHLPQFQPKRAPSKASVGKQEQLHPSILSLGVKYADGSVRGSNARSAALLWALKDVVAAYSPQSPDKVLRFDLDKVVKQHVQHLIDCRPHSIAMGIVIRWIRGEISKIKLDATLPEVQEDLKKKIEEYVDEKILLSSDVVANKIVDRVSDDDVLLVYGRSYSIQCALRKAAVDAGKRFRVVVVDSRPLCEGRKMLKALTQAGIPVTYVDLTAVSYVMGLVDKVLLGAAALLSNGAVISRAGTALVAMTAKRHNVPAIVCCETYKFSDKVQLDSICWNEVGDPEELVTLPGRSDPPLSGWKTVQPLKLLNLRYDLTPMKYVSLVITELGMIPPTSVPVVIREMRKDEAVVSSDL